MPKFPHGAIVIEDMPPFLAQHGESDEDRMVRDVLDFVVQAAEVGVGEAQGPSRDESEGPVLVSACVARREERTSVFSIYMHRSSSIHGQQIVLRFVLF